MSSQPGSIGLEVRALLLSRSTQLMLTDAIVGLVAKGVYIACKHTVLSEADKDEALSSLQNLVGVDDITEAIEPLRFRYEFVNKFGEVKRGQMNQLIWATVDHAKSVKAGRPELRLLKDYSFTFRELAPLFEMLREARNYFAHETADRQELGWNGLLVSALMRVLERGNFLDKERVEDRAMLKEKASVLLARLANQNDQAGAEREHMELKAKHEYEEDEGFKSKLQETSESLQLIASDQVTILKKIGFIESQLQSIGRQSNGLVSPQSAPEVHYQIKIPEQNQSVDSPIEVLAEHASDSEVVLADEVLLSVDGLYEALNKMKEAIKLEFQNDVEWRGPGSNLLHRGVITTILLEEPSMLKEVTEHEDVKWRIKKEKNIMQRQINVFGSEIDKLLSATAWPNQYVQKQEP